MLLRHCLPAGFGFRRRAFIPYTLLVLLTAILFSATAENELLSNGSAIEVQHLVTDVDMSCAEGWEKLGPKCFRAHTLERSWPQALIFCGRFGSVLARIESQKENAFISKLLSKPQRSASASVKTDYWIGLISQQNGDDDALFMWSDGSHVSRYVGFWAKGQPDYRTGSCAKATVETPTSLLWRLEMCSLLLPFVCELPACIKGSFFCHNGGCVPESAHCNGVDDCGDLSDELNCPASHSDTSCLKHEKGESGKIQLFNYRANANCRWVIEGPINSRIQLTFESFETEENQDLVTISDGGPAENVSVVIDILSGSLKPDKQVVYGSTNIMVVGFQSDALIQARGFEASWRAVPFTCGGNLKAQLYSQTFTSPDYGKASYGRGMECAWRIDAPSSQLVSLTIDDFDLDERDILVIYDGGQPSAPALARLSGKHRSDMQLIVSTQNHIYVYFYSKFSSTGGRRGFSIGYKRGCDNTIRQPNGILLSPGHSRVPYASSQSCKYTIELPNTSDDQPMAIAFNHFDVASDDSLQVYEGGEFGRGLHEGDGFNENRKPPKVLYVKQNKAHLVFNTNSLRHSMGWNLTFSTNCPPLNVPGSVTMSTKNTAFGTKVAVSCGSGYEFVTGRGKLFETPCEIGGRWSESVIPDCQPVYCSSVPQIANGFAVSATNVSFGGIARYSCYEGFAFASGKKTEEIYCTEEGKWTQAPQCRAQSCAALSPFSNGERMLVFGDGTGFGTVYSFKCLPGYRREGVATLLCQSDGRWSSSPPFCKKVTCLNIPKIPNGRVAVGGNGLEFGGSARVECAPGFRIMGPDTVTCLANETLNGTPECRDIDECVEGTANCNAKSTACVNMPGGYYCQCRSGFQSQLVCSNPVVIPAWGVIVSSGPPVFAPSAGWCAEDGDSVRSMTITYAVPMTVDRIRLEKFNSSAPSVISIYYANDTTMPLRTTSNLTNIRTHNLMASGSEVIALAEAVEARVIRVVFVEYQEKPCAKVDLLGCQKASCSDINECDDSNGHCQQHCHNTQGSFRCSCEEGYDLFGYNGQNGVFLPDGESGEDSKDTIRYNKSCVPRLCSNISEPVNGKIVTPLDRYAYPNVIQFHCDFGYSMRGASHLKCLADGTWNGTAPFCISASCQGVKNNSAVGLFVQPESPTIAYGHNVTYTCSLQNRPARRSPLTGTRQCIYDPRPDGVEYWLSGNEIDCPLVDCGPPPALSGAFYEGEDNNYKVGSAYLFSCRPPYSLVGKSSYDDRIVRCNVDGTWDLGDLRCEGPVCVDPGTPDDGQTHLDSVEEGAVARFTCNRPGYKPYPTDHINCTLGTVCLLSEDVGISSGFIPDGAFADNSDTTNWGYEPHKSRLSSTGWCGSKDAFIFLSVDLQRIYSLASLRLAGVGGSGHLKGHVTKLQLFYKVQFSQNYDTYPIEFTTEPGNHNKLYQFELNPSIRARYVLLGVSEYENNPCLRFDLQGCLAPLSAAHEIPSHLQVGWNSSVPQCIDAEPPVFTNCPQNPIILSTDQYGQLLPANYEIPTATDNSGPIQYMRVRPEKFEPPYPVNEDTDVTYAAFDSAGNSAECVIRLRVPDTLPPVMKCPDSFVIPGKEGQTDTVAYFNVSSVEVAVQDMSNITELSFSPTKADLKLGSYVTVEATATDSRSNRNSCKFQAAFLPEPCSEWSLRTDSSVVKSCSRQSNGMVCDVQCKEGHRFVEPVASEQTQKLSCSNGKWSAEHPACVPISQEPARYELTISMEYAVKTPVNNAECLKSYHDYVAQYFEGIDTVLTQRCSSSVQVFVRFLNATFTVDQEGGHQMVTANYTLQILPSVLQEVFYSLCGLTLKTIFDLRIPGATTPIRDLLTISSEKIGTPVIACPSINATRSTVSQVFACTQGEILRSGADKDSLPECIPCAKGTAFVKNSCMPCPQGSYQDADGKTTCKPCPELTSTLFKASKSPDACLAVCGNGMYSETGTIPCQLCPRHTYAGPPVKGGYTQCETCPDGTYTAGLGSTGPSQCKKPCAAGSFSVTGLEPCSPCPLNHYQPTIGQQRCVECPNNTVTHETGRSLEAQCKPLDCAGVKCHNKGVCAIVNHKTICECRPGFMGPSCEQQVPVCETQPCFNGATCEPVGGTFRCICPQSYTGNRCQFGPDECIGVNCPNGVCQDLPGVGTTKCICRTGFTGPDCSQISDPCQSDNPCKNGGDCVAMMLGRYKCKCLPGWDGPNCEHNIDDCADSPCALGATCHDLVNDFECECPHGFYGKRCHLKQNLCEPNPCVHGECIDTLFDRQCVCKSGWSGSFCEVNIDDCASSPCQNGATCHDAEDGYQCQCAPGFHGATCQLMVDHCATSPCRNNGTCTNHGPKFQCECRLGYAGELCEHNINECEVENKCDPHGTELCEDRVNAFHCQCRPGYTGDFCETHIDQCVSEPCQNNGTCVDLGSTFKCECRSGWRGEHCTEEAGMCDSKPCQNDGKCVNLVVAEATPTYFCACPEGVSGKNCEIAPNRCIGEPCHNGGVCGDFGSRLECTCAKGFVGEGCQYTLDACHAHMCKNGATCVQEGNSYKCQCPPGYTGVNCETDVDDCSPSPCPLAASCIDQLNGYHCQCAFNMTGANCDKRIDPDYDIRFYDGILPAKAALTVPFHFSSGALSVSLWVRFEKAIDASVFTFYRSKLSSYPSNVTELVRINGESVRLSLFDDETALTLHFPPNQRLNDGNWNNVVLTWTSHEGKYSLVYNGVRVYADKGYGTGKKLDINAWVNLGYPVDATENHGKFVGSISRVNVWTRVLDFEHDIPTIVEKCQSTPVIYNGLVLRFAGYDKLSGKVEKIGKSTCGRDECPNGRTHGCGARERRDPAPIGVESCPSDVFIVTPLKEVNVTWNEPVFASVNPVVRIEQNLKSGQMFTWGEHMVLYVAYDNETNSAECNFVVHINREFCPDIPDPVHGMQACEYWGPNLKYRACSIQCENGYEFSQQPAVFYTCASDGIWRPRHEDAFLFRYPQCSRSSPAARIAHININYPTVTICNAAGKNALAEKLMQRIEQLNEKWNFCAQNVNALDTRCMGVNVTVNCISNDVRRARREAVEQVFNVRIDIPVKREQIMDPKGDRKLDAVEIIQNEALVKEFFDLEQVLPNGRPDINSFRVEDHYNCNVGEVSIGEVCVPCAPGSYYNVATQQCGVCSVGQYQPAAGQTSCVPCPGGQITTAPGAVNEDECKLKCKAGHFLNLERGRCEPCGHGFYQPSAGSFVCVPCGVGKTTLENTATAEDECRDECPDGEHLTAAGTCQPCPMGSFRAKGIHKQCVECPPGTTTEGVRSSQRSDCNTPKCVPGQFLITANKQCQFCPRGTYQDEPLQTTCKLCPTDHTTAALGATHESQCYSTNQCATGEDNCSWHAVCIDLPDDDDVPSYQCKCKPGYRGNGTHCTDACNNFCLNDGVCKKNQIGFVECLCKDNFSGERCELRFQPRTQRVATIASVIGLVVVLLVVIVITIWMISFRAQRRIELAELEKPPLHLESPLVSNFALCGRPGMDRPHSALSLTGDASIRPIGFYYEDDAPYEHSDSREVKSMFIGAGTEETNTDLSESGQESSTPNLQSREMEQRLRHVQQHMYRPSQNDTD